MKRWTSILFRVSLLVLLAGAGAGIYLYSQQPPAPGQIVAPAAESYLVILGARTRPPRSGTGTSKSPDRPCWGCVSGGRRRAIPSKETPGWSARAKALRGRTVTA